MSSSTLKALLDSLVRETLMTSWELMRITIPAAIITKILAEFGLILARLFRVLFAR